MSFSNFIPVQPKKCQCISFNKKGFIVESDNSLFNTGTIMGRSVSFQFPFIKKIYKQLLKLRPTDEPLFFPNVKIDISDYSSICDFIFTKVENTDGESIVWFIYDNSMHFQEVLNYPKSSVKNYDTGKGSRQSEFFE
ncbi:MAG: hypothetical protein ACHQNT_08080 [Bacteroidia bacterium]